MQRRRFLAGLGVLGLSGLVGAQEQGAAVRGPDVIFVPTPGEIVDTMLKLAAVSKKDTVYDLGCGDGRIVITAAQKYGARGVGIDIDPERVEEATANVRKAGVADRVKIIRGDLFEADISAATVVTLYLLTELNLKLRPKLLRDLNPGTRIVSHAFAMGDWKPERTADVSGTTVFLWRIPPRA
ncbi:MAG: SAM-dependent methyltransferase [Burkholderiales bacterium]